MSNTPGTRTWMCLLCGWVYYETLGLPEENIPPGTPWENIPTTWQCPTCGATKEDFTMEQL